MMKGKFDPRTLLGRARDAVVPQRLPDVGTIQGDKPRVLYIVTKYPEFSETYIHEEMVSVSDAYELRILNYERARDVREHGLPHLFVKYRDTNLTYGSFKNINSEFTNAAQRNLVKAADHIIETFRPDFMHGHYMPNVWLMRFLADRHKLPFTLRTHSFDLMGIKPNRMESMLRAVDTPYCRGIFGFREFRDIFLDFGIPAAKLHDSWPVCKVEAFYNEAAREPTRRVLCAGPCTPKKAHEDFVDLAEMMRGSGYQFDLYAKGLHLEKIKKYNAGKGSPVNIMYADPEQMPNVYRKYDWLVYPTNTKVNLVGLPVAVIEAQASGIGVCLQEQTKRQQVQLDFLGGGGHLFKSIEDVPALISKPYSEEMRIAGLRNCWKCDVSIHKEMLDNIWRDIATDGPLHQPV
jgi:glycosyltransferase involved in cell wall biosynthesis